LLPWSLILLWMEGGCLKIIDHWKVCLVDMFRASYTKTLRNGCKSASGTGTWGQKSWERAAARLGSSRAERAGAKQSQAIGRLLLLGPGMSYQNHSLRQESFTKSFTLWGIPLCSYKKCTGDVYLSLSLSLSLSLIYCPCDILIFVITTKKQMTSISEIFFHIMS